MNPGIVTESFDLFNVFDPREALRPGDPRYVECGEERGSKDLLLTVARAIRLTYGNTYHLLSGQRGCGKTTELLLLQHDLSKSKEGARFFVVYCEADSYVDLCDVEYTDVLLAIVRQLWSDLENEGIRLESGRLTGFLSELGSFLASDVLPRDITFDAGIVKLTGEIKRSPDNRHLVRSHLRPRTTQFVEAVNEVIAEAIELLEGKGYKGLVIIVDNLDRILRTVVPGANRSNLEALFLDAAESLRGLGCHMVYTLPPSLHEWAGRLQNLYGTEPKVLPMIPVATRDGLRNERGIAKLEECVLRRLQTASLSMERGFDHADTVRRVCEASGGFGRHLMTLVRSARSYVERPPITRESVERAIRDARFTYQLTCQSKGRWALLREVAATHRIGFSPEQLELLGNELVFEYRDADGPWYDVNPIVREAREFAP